MSADAVEFLTAVRERDNLARRIVAARKALEFKTPLGQSVMRTVDKAIVDARAILSGVAEPAALVVHHHDMEAHAASYNEGYKDAMAQHLADDPTAAQDWLDKHDAEVRGKALEITDEMVERAAAATFNGTDPIQEGDWTWDDVLKHEGERANLWRDDARAVLVAALACQTCGGSGITGSAPDAYFPCPDCSGEHVDLEDTQDDRR